MTAFVIFKVALSCAVAAVVGTLFRGSRIEFLEDVAALLEAVGTILAVLLSLSSFLVWLWT